MTSIERGLLIFTCGNLGALIALGMLVYARWRYDDTRHYVTLRLIRWLAGRVGIGPERLARAIDDMKNEVDDDG